jgi:hypothetical protein
MQIRRMRSLLPEIILGVCLVVVISISMFGSSSSACHAWKHRLNTMASALTSSRTLEQLSDGQQLDRAELRERTQVVLDERPFACY